MMALGRLDIPGSSSTRARSRPASSAAATSPSRTSTKAIGAYAAGKLSKEDLHELESAACPGAGACGGQFTANTMSTMLEFIGLSPAGLNGIPALSPKKAEAAYECGRLVMDLVRRDIRPSQIVTREAIENAAASVVATGGSTNGVLHLLAIAREFGIPFTIDDFDEIAARNAGARRHEAVGPLPRDRRLPRRRRRARRARAAEARPHPRRRATVGGQTLGEVADAAVETEGQDVVLPIERPLKPSGLAADPARQPRARRLRRQALRARTAQLIAARRASSTARKPASPR